MASSFYSNSQHIDFDSVLAMDDQGMVSMFQAIMASGLSGFLGCPAVIYEAALVDFFENTSVREGVIISTVDGQLVEISKEWFAESFDLPVDGLGDLSEIPKDVIFEARSIVSLSGEPLNDKINSLDEQVAATRNDLLEFSAQEQQSLNVITTQLSELVAYINQGGLDVVDIRRVVKETHQELNDKINSLDEQVAATRNDLLEFSAQEQQSLNVITTQLSELVAYINQGGDNKKGKVAVAVALYLLPFIKVKELVML
ncbi:hypothetical protein F511_44183 [Dorcoceras hygrometricum]|uniref:Dystroglycan-like n=1 Tax=Dorcoceras hygrometricum TaxID=472368 RepID=A0A2Z7CVB2_9LAMI|nr:hypothetical protein F511_44183 [Dorcoceras hygrometricum]